MHVHGTWRGEEMTVLFSAVRSSVDIGVEMTHMVDEIDHVEIETVSIFDVPLPLDAIPDKLREDIMALSADVEFEA